MRYICQKKSFYVSSFFIDSNIEIDISTTSLSFREHSLIWCLFPLIKVSRKSTISSTLEFSISFAVQPFSFLVVQHFLLDVPKEVDVPDGAICFDYI